MTRSTLSLSLAFAMLASVVASCDSSPAGEPPPQGTAQAITIRNGKPIDGTSAAVRQQLEQQKLARRRPGNARRTPAPRRLSAAETKQLKDRLAKARTLPVNNSL